MRVVRVVHRWLGLLLAAPLLVMGLSGVLLTLEPVWEAGPAQGIAAAGAGRTGTEPADAVLAVAREAAGPGMRVFRYYPGEGGALARVVLRAGERRVSVPVDAGRLAVVGPLEAGDGVMGWVLRLHQALLVREYGGRQIAGWLGVGLLVLTGLGVPLWWPGSGRWRAALTVPRRARGARLHRALHGASGAWLSLLLLVTGLTGVAQGFPRTTRAVLGVPDAQPRRGGGPGGALDVEAGLRRAEEALPGYRVAMVQFGGDGDPVRMTLRPVGEEGTRVSRVVVVEAAGDAVVSVAPAPRGGELVLRWSHDLHESQGLGPVWRGLMVVGGAALPLMGVTGALLWWRKRRNRAQAATAG